MRKLLLLYNPKAGNKTFKKYLDPIIYIFQEGGYEVSIHRTRDQLDIDVVIEYYAGANDLLDAVVVCGGDGSINLVVNAMLKHRLDVPLGIIPSGTANDFAKHLKIPQNPVKAAEAITQGIIMRTDLGNVNGRYFINVCAAGMFTNISQHININFKNRFGKLAYYIKGVEQLPSFMPMHVKFTHSNGVIEGGVYFFFALNSSGTGGFEKLSPGASIEDGMFDFIAFKECPVHELALLFVKVLAGDYLDDPRVIFFRDSHVKVELTRPLADPTLLESDVDGEAGPNLPIEIINERQAFQIFIPRRLNT